MRDARVPDARRPTPDARCPTPECPAPGRHTETRRPAGRAPRGATAVRFRSRSCRRRLRPPPRLPGRPHGDPCAIHVGSPGSIGDGRGEQRPRRARVTIVNYVWAAAGARPRGAALAWRARAVRLNGLAGRGVRGEHATRGRPHRGSRRSGRHATRGRPRRVSRSLGRRATRCADTNDARTRTSEATSVTGSGSGSRSTSALSGEESPSNAAEPAAGIPPFPRPARTIVLPSSVQPCGSIVLRSSEQSAGTRLPASALAGVDALP